MNINGNLRKFTKEECETTTYGSGSIFEEIHEFLKSNNLEFVWLGFAYSTDNKSIIGELNKWLAKAKLKHKIIKKTPKRILILFNSDDDAAVFKLTFM